MLRRSMMGRRRAILMTISMGALMATAALPATADPTSEYRIIDLGVGDNSEARSVNELGHVVGAREAHPFLWRDGRVTDLLPEGEFGQATDVNNFDQVVGNRFVDGVSHAFLWRRGVLVDLGALPGGNSSFAQAINDRGDVVGFSSGSGPGLHAFRWRDGVMTDLGTLGGALNATAFDINRAGVVVGGSGDFNSVAVRWRRNGATEPLTDVPSTARAVNDFGDVTGLAFGGTTHGFLWHRGQFTEIPTPVGAFFLQPFGINNRTQLVGNTSVGAFLWQAGQLTILPGLTGAASTGHDINNRGLVVGSSAANPNGLNQHAVLWTR